MWFKNADVGVAIVTGPVSNLMVIDSDTYHSGAAQLTLETPLISRSGNGGIHYFFRFNPYLTSFKNHTMHVELLGQGNIVVAPPTLHPNGNEYRWQTPDIEHVDQLPICPDSILKYAPVQKENG